MKKLIKLQIKSEKIMQNEELKALRGGYDVPNCHCYCSTRDVIPTKLGAMAAANQAECAYNCDEINCTAEWNCESN